MKIESIDINDSIQKAKEMLVKEKNVSPAFKAIFELILFIMSILVKRLKVNSSNSSKPPSMDPNRKRKQKEKSDKKRGGQIGHKGSRLDKVENPDKIKKIKIDKKTLPPGDYKEAGHESRQVINITIKKTVTEYRAQILINNNGKKFVAPFPEGIKNDVQYGNALKATAVYMSQFQLIPYNRIQDYFLEQMKIPLSSGSIFNFNKDAYDLLETFDNIAKNKIIQSSVAHSDETGINIDGKRNWLHVASNNLWTYFFPHEKRGSIAIDDIGIIPNFSGILCHDHWKPYYNYNCLHSLCNAHHLRELEKSIEDDNHKWAKQLKDFLLAANQKTIDSGGVLSKEVALEYRTKYKEILKVADIECPAPPKIIGKRGRVKKSKSRNLIERLIKFEDDVLRFMENEHVPFTNNLGENDIRMTKVQQKISGCFRSFEGAYLFCRIRSYLSTCRKHNVSATDGLRSLFEGKLPSFCY